MVDKNWGDGPAPEDPGIPADDFSTLGPIEDPGMVDLALGNKGSRGLDKEAPAVGDLAAGSAPAAGKNITPAAALVAPGSVAAERGLGLDMAAQVKARVEAERAGRNSGSGSGTGGGGGSGNNTGGSSGGASGPGGGSGSGDSGVGAAAGGSAGGGGSDSGGTAGGGSGSGDGPVPGPGEAAGVEAAYVRQCVDANELGDGLLFAALHRKNYTFNKTSTEWLAWCGHHWQRDEMEKALAAVEDVAGRYLEAAGGLSDRVTELSEKLAKTVSDDAGKKKDVDVLARKISTLKNQRKKFFKRADKLRSETGRQNCLKFARSNHLPLACLGHQLDQEPMLLATPSGVIDLETGRIRPGRQADFILTASPTPWTGFAEKPALFLQTLNEIFESSQAIIDYLQRLLGYGITGLVTEHIFPVFQGRGRNGKSMLMDIIREVIGPLAAPIRPELLLEQSKNRSAAAPSPDIMALRGLRMAIAEETDEGSKFSASRVKHFTGGTELTGRNPHDKYDTTFSPAHLLFLLTNERPAAPASDHAFWARMRLIEFRLSFVMDPKADFERPINKELAKQILATERSQILAWLVEGCLKWQADGLKPPPEVLQATHMYQRAEDIIGDFIDECLDVEGGAKCKSTDVYNLYCRWYGPNQGRFPWKHKRFSSDLIRRGFKNEKSHGIKMFFGFDINHAAAAEYTYAGDN